MNEYKIDMNSYRTGCIAGSVDNRMIIAVKIRHRSLTYIPKEYCDKIMSYNGFELLYLKRVL